MRFLTAILALMPVSISSAQSPGGARLRGESESTQTRKRIAEAQQKFADGQTAEGMDQLQKVLEVSGHELILVKDNNYQPARRLIQITHALLPPSALKTYRDRMEAPAAKLLAAGTAARDAAILSELRDRYFAARPTEKALDLLGELHFERGEFTEAERCWRMLLPATDAQEMVFPQPIGDAAGYRAKALLAAFASGERTRAAAELTAFLKDHPKAKGRLAGVEGPYAETLAAYAQQSTEPDTAVLRLPRFPAMRPLWKTPIPRDSKDGNVPRPASIPAAKTLTFFPVILDGHAYIADEARIIAFDLKTGQSRVAFDLRQEAEFRHWNAPDLAMPNLQGTVTALEVADGRLFGRLGSTGLAEGDKKRLANSLFAFESHGGTLKKTWSASAPALALWDSAPLVAEDRVYATFLRTDERGRIVLGLACQGPTGKPLWQTEFAEWDAVPAAPAPVGQLAAAGNAIVCSTNTGLTVALDRATGRPAWAYRNPPASKPGNAHRDAFPPLAKGGRVFIAPADGDRLAALDLDTGKPLWESPPLAVQQLLGIADGKVIAAIAGPHKGIRGFQLSDGSTREPLGWQNHDDPFLATYGRGIATENGILWPTMEKLYRLNPADGSVQTIPKPGPHGNLAFGQGMLVVATPTEVWAYEGIPESKEAERSTPPVIRRPVVAPIVAEFEPVQADTIHFPVELEKTVPGPVSVEPEAGVRVGTLRIGFVNPYQILALGAGGEPVWGLDSFGRSRTVLQAIESGPRFSPHLLAVKAGVWVHVNDGERWLVSAETGRILRREKSVEVTWASPPVALPLGKAAFPDGPGLVRCFDETFRKHWNFEAGGEASLTGAAPQCVLLGQAFLAAFHRNYGIEIQRIDPNTGRALWRRPAVVDAPTFQWATASADRTALYLTAASKLHAIDLATGRELWAADTGMQGAIAVRGRHNVIVYSQSQRSDWGEATELLAGRFLERPRVENLFGYLGTLAESAWNQPIRLAAFDPDTGRAEGRQEIPAGPAARVEFRGGKLVVRSPGTVSWWTAKP